MARNTKIIWPERSECCPICIKRDEISSGSFAREWEGTLAKLKFRMIECFAVGQNTNNLELEVRQNLKLKDFVVATAPEDTEELLKRLEINNKIDEYNEIYDYKQLYGRYSNKSN